MGIKHLPNLFGDKIHALPVLVLYLTDGCNSRCITCDIWRSPRRNMDINLFQQILTACTDLNVRWVALSGGEAMQHPNWATMARQLRDAGIYVMLLTNGLLLKKQQDDVLNSVDEVVISLDAGDAATYQHIRGVDAFDLILDGIRSLREQNVAVTTRTTLQRANFRQMPAIIDAALSVDVNQISFLTVDVSNEYAFGPRFDPDLVILPDQHRQSLTPDEITEFEHILTDIETRYTDLFNTGRIAESPEKLWRMVTYFRAINGEIDFIPPRCNAPHISTVIEVDGTVRPCYFLPEYGNMQSQPLKDVLNSNIAQDLRRAYRTGKRPECERCVCPLYKGARSLIRL